MYKRKPRRTLGNAKPLTGVSMLRAAASLMGGRQLGGSTPGCARVCLRLLLRVDESAATPL